MLNFSNFFHSSAGKILMSIILGFGLASLFRKACKGKNCMIFQAPPLEELDNVVYKYNNKCFKFQSSATKCDKSKKIVGFGEKEL
jgi:hypothetical protein